MKKRLIVAVNGELYVNIPCDRLESDAFYLYGYLKDQMVAIISIGSFDRAYLSEVKE